MRASAGGWARAGIKQGRWLLRDVIVNVIAGSPLVPAPLRCLVYRLYGIRTEVWNIRAGCRFTGNRVTIGRHAFVNTGCLFDELGSIAIGERCQIAPEVAFVTSSHVIGPADKRAGAIISAPIVIGSGCWIGVRATILPGVTVGDGCVVAAGAVVARDCAPHGLYAGVPARRIRDLRT